MGASAARRGRRQARELILAGSADAYGAWADYLTAWERGDRPPDPPALDPAYYHDDTWQRLVNRIVTAVNAGMTRWSEGLVHGTERATDEPSYARVLITSRVPLNRVRRLAGHPSLPPDLREQLTKQVEATIRSAQEQLEDQCSRLRATSPRFADRRMQTIRENSFARVLSDDAEAALLQFDSPPVQRQSYRRIYPS